ncbi:hypothetical protein MHPYR_490038 [uncultured Mycobacterium sp.]|uniref:HTH cro/C1-type domain-containing protein n=1 Tax=uncultured Mycobacterium sp. TaxID=171292 RepID=A0A1Y5PGH9_9MYCO|nr:hypothetical protein MHPYR_490038 [uncultured Mycobacterium sp.]
MPNIDENAKRWQTELSRRVGRAVQDARKSRGWTAIELSKRCSELNYPISRVAISKIESNSRAGKLDLAELVVLAAALNTSPVSLVYPGPYDEEVELFPGENHTQFMAAQWFSAIPEGPYDELRRWADSVTELNAWRRLSDLESTVWYGGADAKLQAQILKEAQRLRQQLGIADA